MRLYLPDLAGVAACVRLVVALRLPAWAGPSSRGPKLGPTGRSGRAR